MYLYILIFIIHSIFLFSIFDLYFKSPIINGLEPISFDSKGTCKRLVLIVSDGLRSDILFNQNKRRPHNQFLRNICLNEGVWGLSHTHVPTESRPGHVTLIAGIYEDITAIFKGWKENPVMFDTTFNRSRNTWAWGSSDIINIFNKGNLKHNMHSHSYDANFQDFASPEPLLLDQWVFNEVEKFFRDAKLYNKTLNDMVKEDKIIFFLHLLGMDTTGHVQKPHTKKYIDNLNYLDKQLAKSVEVFEDFYKNDNKTCFIFTADHGMTDWGSHGSGSDEETQTPFIAWGAGLRKPLHRKNITYDEFTKYKLPIYEDQDLMRRKAVQFEQGDIAPLTSCLLGTPTPVNSVGRLPADVLADESYERICLLNNAKQIYRQYVSLHGRKERDIKRVLFKPYPKNDFLKQAFGRTGALENGNASFYNDLMDDCFRGIDYYRHYDLKGLEIVIGTSYVLWILCILNLHFFNYRHTQLAFGTTTMIRVVVKFKFSLAIALIVGLYLKCSHSPFSHYLYYSLALFLSCFLYTLAKCNPSFKPLSNQKTIIGHTFIGRKIIITYVFNLFITACLINAFFNRAAMTLVLCSYAIYLAALSFYTKIVYIPKYLLIKFITLSLLLCPFYFLKLPGQYSTSVLFNSLAWFVVIFEKTYLSSSKIDPKTIKSQIFRLDNVIHYVVAISSIVIYSACRNEAFYDIIKSTFSCDESDITSSDRGGQVSKTCLAKGTSRILFINVPTWLSVIAPLLLFIRSTLYDSDKLNLSIYSHHKKYDGEVGGGRKGTNHSTHPSLSLLNLTLLTYFSTLSVSYEFVFLVLLQLLLQTWTDLYCQMYHSAPTDDTKALVLVTLATHYVSLMFAAFFGIGNLASISSFDPGYTLCFLSVFAPYTMALLIMGKITVPLVMVTNYVTYVVVQECDKFSGRQKLFGSQSDALPTGDGVVAVGSENVIRNNCLTSSLRAGREVIEGAVEGSMVRDTFFVNTLMVFEVMSLYFYFNLKTEGSWLDVGSSLSHYIIANCMFAFVASLCYASKRLLTSITSSLKLGYTNL